MLNSTLFAGLPIETHTKLSSEIIERSFERGTTIFHENDANTGVYFMKMGVIKLYIKDAIGRESIFDFNGKGELLGDRAMFTSDNHFYSAKCITQVCVQFIPKALFMEAVQESDEMMKKILVNMSEESIRQIRHSQLLSQNNLKQRIAFSFLYLQQKNTETDNWTIEINREDLANYVGTAKESAVRAMHDFKANGIIESSGRRISIIKPTALRTIAKIDA